MNILGWTKRHSQRDGTLSHHTFPNIGRPKQITLTTSTMLHCTKIKQRDSTLLHGPNLLNPPLPSPHPTFPNIWSPKANYTDWGAGIAQWLERRTHDWKVAGSNPRWNGGRIVFSRVNFLCWLLFRYPFQPRVTTVARKRSQSFCQKCRWQVTAKHAYTDLTYVAFIEPCFGIGHNLSLICQMTSEDIKHQLIITILHCSGAVWESRWPSWAVRHNEPSGFRGRKAILNHASALVSACP